MPKIHYYDVEIYRYHTTPCGRDGMSSTMTYTKNWHDVTCECCKSGKRKYLYQAIEEFEFELSTIERRRRALETQAVNLWVTLYKTKRELEKVATT